MKLYATIRVLERLNSRALFLAAIILICAFNYKSVSYAADDDSDQWVTVTHSYTTSQYLKYSYVYPFVYVPYDALLDALGQTPSSELTIRIDSITIDTLSGPSDIFTRYNNWTWETCQVDYTNGSGGSGTKTFYPNESYVIDYGGGEINFKFNPPAGFIQGTYIAGNTYGGYVDQKYTIVISVLKPPEPPLTDNEALNKIANQQEQFRNEDRDNAQQAGNDASSFVNEMQGLESKWEILWLPIKFTSQVISVFSGGTSSANYISAYGNVEGYSYDESTGFLVPVYGSPIQTVADIDVPGGASITFPAYTLPVLDLQIWDAYTFDLTSIKDDFPLLFDALYVVISILEVYWFIAFCRDKYHEVFGDE